MPALKRSGVGTLIGNFRVMTGKILRKHEITLTEALVINVVAVALVVGGICSWLVTYLGTAEVHRREHELLTEIARSIGTQVGRAMEERYTDVNFTRGLLEQEMSNASAKDKRHLMERTQSSHQHFSWLGIVEPDGRIAIGTGGLLEGLNIKGRNWFEGALTQQVFFGNQHPAKLLASHIKNPDGAHLYLLDIALPLRRADGALAGVVGSHLNWKMVEDVVRNALSSQSHNGQLSAAVLSREGDILYDTNRTTGNVKSLFDKGREGDMLEHLWPTETEPSVLITQQVPASGLFPGMDWHIVVRTPVSLVNRGISELKWQILTWSLVAGTLFIALGLFAVRSVTRPLSKLTEEIVRFGNEGELIDSSPSGKFSELRLLHEKFHQMVHKVRQQNDQLRDTQFEIVQSLARAGEFRDNETGTHVTRMSLCCAHLAELAGLDREKIELIRLASEMHDIGKIGIPDQILLKQGRFDENERRIMETHAEIGARILTGLDTPLITLARSIALTHHEKWDGSGYPNRLMRHSIPIEGRITAICDVFDALLSSRPYKQAWTIDRVRALLQEQAGKHFDPTLIPIFLDNINDFIEIRSKFSDEQAMTCSPIEAKAAVAN